MLKEPIKAGKLIVEVIRGESTSAIQDTMNEWLSGQPEDVLVYDMSYQVVRADTHNEYSILIVYGLSYSKKSIMKV